MKEHIERLLGKVINRETVLYGVFGVGTSVLNVVLFSGLLAVGMPYKIANIITLVVVKLAAYVCNKNFVFQSHCANLRELLGEFGRFVVARGATALIDYFGLILMVDLLLLPKVPSKVFLTVFVILINYFVGKSHVFKNKPSDT